MNLQDFKADLDRIYEQYKREWIQNHPDATPEDYEKAIRDIASRLGY